MYNLIREVTKDSKYKHKSYRGNIIMTIISFPCHEETFYYMKGDYMASNKILKQKEATVNEITKNLIILKHSYY